MDIMSGKDNKDMTTLPDFFAPSVLEGKKKIGVIKELMTEDVDAEVRRVTTDTLKSLKQRVMKWKK